MPIRQIIVYRPFVIFLFIANLLGTIYGYFWYESQLVNTPLHFILFVPDSPTASLFFTIFLGCFLFSVRFPYIEALAVTSLFKYGVWAVVMNLFTLIIDGSLRWEGYMLIGSHALMALQGLLYVPYYTFKLRHLAFAGIILLHNEIIDYVFGMMPIYGSLTEFMKPIGYFTFWLSVFTIFLVYRLVVQKNISEQ